MEHPYVELRFREYPPSEMQSRSQEFHREMDRRRTVRDFSDRAIPVEVMRNAVAAAGTAPSGAHKQPWTFVLVGDPLTKRRIREAAEEEERRNYGGRMPPAWLDDLAPLGTDANKPFLTTCPWLVAIFARTYSEEAQGKRKHYYVPESVGIATGLLIAALHHSGVATLTHTPSPMGFLRDVLGRPDSERAFLLLAAGYPAASCRVPDLRRKPLPEILVEVHGEGA